MTLTPRSRLAAAKAGKMVLCEKPLGRTAEEAKAMVDAVEKAKVRTWSGTTTGAFPPLVLLKKLLDEDRFGRNLSLSFPVLAGLDHLAGSASGRRGLWRLDSAVSGSVSPETCWPTTLIWRYG